MTKEYYLYVGGQKIKVSKQITKSTGKKENMKNI